MNGTFNHGLSGGGEPVFLTFYLFIGNKESFYFINSIMDMADILLHHII
jgi:hypothetical protein